MSFADGWISGILRFLAIFIIFIFDVAHYFPALDDRTNTEDLQLSYAGDEFDILEI